MRPIHCGSCGRPIEGSCRCEPEQECCGEYATCDQDCAALVQATEPRIPDFIDPEKLGETRITVGTEVAALQEELRSTRAELDHVSVTLGEQVRDLSEQNDALRAEVDQVTDERDTLLHVRETLRAEVERMRPVVETAERYRDEGWGIHQGHGVVTAVDAYREQEDTASTGNND